MAKVLEVVNVNKTIKGRQIINNMTFYLNSGDVFGFLGPNGAGKSTTLKMILGLEKVDSGRITICGFDIKRERKMALSYAGGFVESPVMYKHLTGMQNLKYYARIRCKKGKLPEDIDELIEKFGLTKRINDPISEYSLGMYQRLGILQAILHKPKLLILDEPTNGLDPVGIKEVRDLIQYLAKEENIAIIVSSHLLSEVETICDRVGMILNGEMSDVSTKEEFVSDISNSGIYRFMLSDVSKALMYLEKYEMITVTEEYVDIVINKNELNKIMKKLIDKGVAILSVQPVTKTLEESFIERAGGVHQID
ncbi:MAG: ABC transporter ATP-binding protein [Clostridiales bacterium]|nr:ABC transporter ATP-binding protein [Clostridiales bacterium]